MLTRVRVGLFEPDPALLFKLAVLLFVIFFLSFDLFIRSHLFVIFSGEITESILGWCCLLLPLTLHSSFINKIFQLNEDSFGPFIEDRTFIILRRPYHEHLLPLPCYRSS